MGRIYEEYINEVRDEQGGLVKLTFNVPENFNFAYDVVDRLAEKSPGKTAMMWLNEKGEEHRFTFSEMKRYSDKAANVFLSAGIGKGDPVMLVLKRHYQFWFALLGLCKIGAVAVPATHLLTPKDFVYRFNAAGVKAVVCTSDGETAAHIDEAQKSAETLTTKMIVRGTRGGWLDFDGLVCRAGERLVRPAGNQAAHNSDPMLLYFTSGTTAMPKMVMHDFAYPIAHIVTAVYWHNVNPEGLHLTVADTGWAKAVWGKIFGQWFAEGGILTYDYDKFVPGELISVISRNKVTTFCAPPTLYRFFIKEDLHKFDLGSLEYCTIAGEALNPEVFNQFLEATGIKLMEGFGQTETTLSVCTLKGMTPKPGSMGKPSPAWDVDLVDDSGKSVQPGVVGEIVLHIGDTHPVGMFRGYYRDQERTDSVWHDGLYHTGDMAWKDEDGYFWYVGRTDDLIKSSGYRIGPFEIESVLMEHPAVLECAVTGVPDEVRGQLVKATVVLARGYEASDALRAELQEYVKTHTAPYKYPRILEFVSELPKTISGKIRRVEIRGQHK